MIVTNFEPFPVFETKRLLLRELTVEDAQDIFDLRSNEEAMTYIDRPRAKTLEDAVALIEMMTNLKAIGEGINWAMHVKELGKVIGTIGFWRMQKEHDRAEIGYMMLPSFHGNGYMQEAMDEVIDYGFREMNLHSIEANINPANAASRKILERNNFKQEAYFRENYYFEGRYKDSAIFSLLKGEKQKIF